MKTIRLALTDNKDFRLVNVELPERPAQYIYNRYSESTRTEAANEYDRIEKYNSEIKRLVDSCPVVSDAEKARGIISEGLAASEFIMPYKIYQIIGHQAQVIKFNADRIAILSKSESEEKEEPNSAHSYTEGYEVTDPLGGLQPTQVKDVFSRTEVREHQIKFAKWYSGMEESKVINAYNRYLKENGF